MRAVLIFVLAIWPQTALASDGLADRRAQCVGWMMSAYPTGLDEQWCTTQFALPSAFHFQCARAQHKGFTTEGQRNACASFFARAADQATSGYVLK